MRLTWLIGVLGANMSAYAVPPSDSAGKFHDWFQSLTMPGSPNTRCCTIADCRIVEAKWNEQTRHYEAKVIREVFSKGLGRPIATEEDNEAYQTARIAWVNRWVTRYGDSPDVWIEIPEAKVNTVRNPTGQAVLCWSVFNREANGVYCFVPFIAAFNDWFERMTEVV